MDIFILEIINLMILIMYIKQVKQLIYLKEIYNMQLVKLIEDILNKYMKFQ